MKYIILTILVIWGVVCTIKTGLTSFEQINKKDDVKENVVYKIEKGVHGKEMLYSVTRNKQNKTITVSLLDEETGDTLSTRVIKDRGGKLTTHIFE